LVTFGKEFEEKIEVIYWGVPPKNFEKQYIKEKVKILFVNSGNINTALHFYGKGGAEVIQAFRILSQKYDNIELLIRSGMPKSVKKEIMMLKEATAIDQPIPWSELEKEWMTADIFVLPNHINTPAQVLLDAISYELPVVTTNVWANCEFIEDGKTGFLVNNPRSRYFEEGPILRLSELEKEIVKGAQPEVVEVLVEKISLLIENEKLRRQMGRAGRWEIEHGKFSIKRRNEKLKRILDEATLTEEQK
jgi:glycosyltransferase involved in cell wall biosynthesis